MKRSSYGFDHNAWGNRLVVNRSLDLWREYGTEAGLFEIQRAWSRFAFRRDARELALTPKRIAELADKTFDHELREGLPISGREMWDQYRESRSISARERNIWTEAFTEAYTKQLEESISDLIPRELEGKLPIFCSLVSAVATHVEAGHDPDDFGITLGRKMPEIVKYHPRKAMIISEGKREGTEEARRNWTWQTSPDPTMIRWFGFIHPPSEWIMNAGEAELYEKAYSDAYFSLIRKNIDKLVPKKAWKNAYLICSLFDEMEAQKNVRKHDTRGGWNYIRSQREHDLYISELRRDEERKRYEARHQPKAPAPTMGISNPAQFASPQVSITSGAKAAFEESGEQPAKYLDRHFSGDFGESPDVDLNRQNMATEGMVMSIYTLSTGVRFYIITDDGHLMTTLLLPHEY